MHRTDLHINTSRNIPQSILEIRKIANKEIDSSSVRIFPVDVNAKHPQH